MEGTVSWVRRDDGRGLRGGIPGAGAGVGSMAAFVVWVMEALEAAVLRGAFVAGVAVAATLDGGLAVAVLAAFFVTVLAIGAAGAAADWLLGLVAGAAALAVVVDLTDCTVTGSLLAERVGSGSSHGVLGSGLAGDCIGWPTAANINLYIEANMAGPGGMVPHSQ